MYKKYIVVENAGYEREVDVCEFESEQEARGFVDRAYLGQEEIDELHVMIAVETNGHREY